MRLDFEVRSSNPLFNYTLRSDDVRLDFEVRSSNPPAPMLQATVLFKECIARNKMEGFCLGVSPRYTERHFRHQTDLTEPQGTLKI